MPVMCLRCARIYMYRGQPGVRCPKCAFCKWADPRTLCRNVAAGGDAGAAAIKQMTGILWHAADFVETEDINEDVASDLA